MEYLVFFKRICGTIDFAKTFGTLPEAKTYAADLYEQLSRQEGYSKGAEAAQGLHEGLEPYSENRAYTLGAYDLFYSANSYPVGSIFLKGYTSPEQIDSILNGAEVSGSNKAETKPRRGRPRKMYI